MFDGIATGLRCEAEAVPFAVDTQKPTPKLLIIPLEGINNFSISQSTHRAFGEHISYDYNLVVARLVDCALLINDHLNVSGGEAKVLKLAVEDA